jgi:hypothetical protein
VQLLCCLLTCCTPDVAAVVLVLGPIRSLPDHTVRKAGFYGELLIYFCKVVKVNINFNPITIKMLKLFNFGTYKHVI